MAIKSLNEQLKEANMKSMKVKVDREPKETCCPEPVQEEIPYGLRVELNKDSLKNLGLSSSDFALDGKVQILCECDVTEIRSSKSTSWDSENVELQICKMAIVKEDDDK